MATIDTFHTKTNTRSARKLPTFALPRFDGARVKETIENTFMATLFVGGAALVVRAIAEAFIAH